MKLGISEDRAYKKYPQRFSYRIKFAQFVFAFTCKFFSSRPLN